MMLCWVGNEDANHRLHIPCPGVTTTTKEKMSAPEGLQKAGTKDDKGTEFPPPGYRPTPINRLLVNALDLTAPASDALLKNRKNAWVQVAGHPGSFAPAGPHTIWKKRLSAENNETVAYRALMADGVRDVVPRFHREVEYGGEIFIEIEDLLQHFTDPSIMDIKMGTRTFLESEVKNPILRKDLYEKMVKLDASEPTAEEHSQKAITKLRYMQFRERGSSTSSLGFRLEAIRMSGEAPQTSLQKIKTDAEVRQLMGKFLRYNREMRKKLSKRLKEIRRKFEQSKFFKNHEVIGSSILILHDKNKNIGAWLIDFAKTLHVEGTTLTHRVPWEVGNHEDGYLMGVDSLIRIVKELKADCNAQSCEIPNDLSKSSESLSSSSSTNTSDPATSEIPSHISSSQQLSSIATKRQKSEGGSDCKVLTQNHVLKTAVTVKNT